MARPKKDNEASVPGALPPGMREELDSCDITALKNHVVQSTAILRANKKAKKMDLELEGAKQRVKDLSEEYAETSKAKEAIISYALIRLGEMGVDLDDEV